MNKQDELELKVLLNSHLQKEREAALEILDRTKKFNNPELIRKNYLIGKIKDLLEALSPDDKQR
jgi:hypothetical protein